MRKYVQMFKGIPMPRYRSNSDNSTCRLRARQRLKLFELIGKECVCCGEKHPFLLTFDHVYDDGKQHRIGNSSVQVYREMLNDPRAKERYQTMCISCNFAKYLYGQCPHASGMTPEEGYAQLENKGAEEVGFSFNKGGMMRCGSRWIPWERAFPVLHARFSEVL